MKNGRNSIIVLTVIGFTAAAAWNTGVKPGRGKIKAKP